MNILANNFQHKTLHITQTLLHSRSILRHFCLAIHILISLYNNKQTEYYSIQWYHRLRKRGKRRHEVATFDRCIQIFDSQNYGCSKFNFDNNFRPNDNFQPQIWYFWKKHL